MQFLLYGAYGYTGTLIAEQAASLGMKPVLAGRSAQKLKVLADRLDFEYRVCDLNDPADLDDLLKDFSVVLHAAGPYRYTAKPMLEACLRTKTHYLDITGEIEIFELAASLTEQAQQAGIMLLPGTGFDVVPTDCMALYLKQLLPSATHLQLAFSASGGAGFSRGTALTMVENLGEGAAVRKNGIIKKVPLGHESLRVPFTDEKQWFVMTIPWGDVSTAYHSTGIPNIEVYMSFPPKRYNMIKMMPYFNWALRIPFVKSIARNKVNQGAAGPTDEQRDGANNLVWGKVWNDQGDSKSARMSMPNGYTLTALSSLLCTQKVLDGNAPVGFQTPAKAYGTDLIMEIEGVVRQDL